MKLCFHNTLTNKKEFFYPIKEREVLMYNCGPTLYDRQHVGNLSMFVFTDILRRTLEYFGYKVNQVINYTDFGHLSGDNEGNADIGEDRMTKGLKRENLLPTLENMRILAEKYAKIFREDLCELNIKTNDIKFPFASDYIKEQIDLIEKIEANDYTYHTDDGLYFNTEKFENYGKLGNINIENQKAGARVAVSGNKINPADFLLWKADSKNGWQSPWGMGFPGWHIECSAMIIKLLGEQIDIHTGGIEHIGVHHNNEIAQSESATGKSPFSRFWLHREHLKLDDQKIGKSVGNVMYIDDIKKKGIHPMSLRFLLLQAHYKTPSNLTDEALKSAQNTLEKITTTYYYSKNTAKEDKDVKQKFEKSMQDDLNTPLALALLSKANSKSQVDNIDSILGLNIKSISEEIFNIPEDIINLIKERDEARENKNWSRSDDIRNEIEKEGYIIEDSENRTLVRKTIKSLI